MRKGIIIILALAIFGLFLTWYDHNQQAAPNGDPEEEEKVVLNDSMNILILGIDSEKGNIGRTDTIILLNFKPDREEIYLMSIPRDTRVKIKGNYDKINAAYVYGGPELARETVGDLLNIKIDHHVIFNFETFKELIDMVEGLEVDVPVRMYYPSENIDLQPGKQTLNGHDALAYARYRGTSEGDLGRSKRQHEIITLLIDKLFAPKMLIKMPRIIQSVAEHIEHDLTAKDLGTIAAVGGQVKSKPIKSIMLPGKNEKIKGIWYFIADEEEILEQNSGF